MSGLTIGIIVGSITWFLLQRVGKHFLERLVLPRALDWWAAFSKKMALNRAELLLKTFEFDLKLATNIQLFVLRIEQRQYRSETIPQAIVVLLILAIFVVSTEQTTGADNTTRIVIGVILVYALSIVSFIFESRRDYLVFADFTQYRSRIINRLEALFRASGLDENEIRDRIERVPPTPLPTPLPI
jgi:hypothetical protein